MIIYIYIYISSICADSTESLVSLSVYFPINRRSRKIPENVSSICIDVCNSLLVGHIGVSMCRSSYENVVYEFVFCLLAVSSMSCSSFMDRLRDRKQVAVQLQFF